MKHEQGATRAFKISGDALSAVTTVASESMRGLKSSIEMLILKGYKMYQIESKVLGSLRINAVESALKDVNPNTSNKIIQNDEN